MSDVTFWSVVVIVAMLNVLAIAMVGPDVWRRRGLGPTATFAFVILLANGLFLGQLWLDYVNWQGDEKAERLNHQPRNHPARQAR